MLRKSIPFLIPCYDMCTIYSVKSNNFILCANKETGNVTSDAFIVTTDKPKKTERQKEDLAKVLVI